MTNIPTQSTPRILIVDDNPAIHDDFRKILVPADNQQDLADAALAFLGEDAMPSGSSFDLDVVLDSALQGEEGYHKVVAALAEERPYTMVFCDMRMPPGWDGLKTVEQMFEADSDLQVVICSAYSDNTWRDISERLGLSDRLLILKKPFDNAEVLQMAVSLIEKRRLIDAAQLKSDELEQLVDERTRNLHSERAESQRLLAAIDSLMLRTDGDGIVRMWNRSAAETFGLDSARVIGEAFGCLPIQWEDTEAATSLVCQNDRGTSSRVELGFRDVANTSKVVGFSSYPVYDGVEFNGTLLLGADLTKHRLLEQQLQNAQKLESVGQLAAGVAHEINTPMQYVGDNLNYVKTKFDKLSDYLKSSMQILEAAQEQGFESDRVSEVQAQAKKLKLTKLFDQIPEALNDSIEGVEHVSRIVRAMKELSHPGAEEKTQVDINRSLETTLTVSANEWKYVAAIEKQLDPDLQFIAGFPGELHQVFLNLVVNAAHAISDMTAGGSNGRGTISVRSMRSPDGVRIEIADTGGGIPAKIRERIFDPFFTTKEVGKGTGQGLAIAHNVIVQKHGGRLTFDVEEGVGTRFIIELPTLQASADEAFAEDTSNQTLVASE